MSSTAPAHPHLPIGVLPPILHLPQQPLLPHRPRAAAAPPPPLLHRRRSCPSSTPSPPQQRRTSAPPSRPRRRSLPSSISQAAATLHPPNLRLRARARDGAPSSDSPVEAPLPFSHGGGAPASPNLAAVRSNQRRPLPPRTPPWQARWIWTAWLRSPNVDVVEVNLDIVYLYTSIYTSWWRRFLASDLRML
ncbi:hypothetical protein BRADI_4g30745v3 [Brachypodium distachyon]|uniref:Uncharacterized protein n=1 Tax=Brachypodium distachyon TaxID=15368 RepID=A0A2K2CRH7_BRADI|nr:hypothetical protein BRADI_4g30745v3 [Brachypodium distachyon]